VRFYAAILGEVPYPSTTIAVVDAMLPGGHSPAYFTLLQQPSPIQTPPSVWQRDPAAFRGFPEFFLAHELAHQWWGQAVGPKNYRERWISEGLSQYFAAMYAEHAHGEETLHEMLAAFRRWSSSQSEFGPLSLGERLGHVEGGGRVLRALAYNKGAAVLHMLRRMLGHDAFVRGLRRFYRDHRFGAAGTDDLQRAFEAESGESLERFFDSWIRGAALPTVDATVLIAPTAVTVQFEQAANGIFHLPVTVTVLYRDGRADETVLVMTDARLEQTIPTSGDVRRVEINGDDAALGEFNVRERRVR
jgi:aminopeptidase N